MIKLSNRQLKNADRQGGIELMIRWPEDLPRPTMALDSERPATPLEETRARALLDAELPRRDLVIRRVMIACVRRPDGPGVEARDAIEPHLAVWIIGRRWLGSIPGDRPPMMFASNT